MILLAFLFGLLIGSFLNVCIHRWPIDESVVRPRSHCPRCHAPIAWYDNLPVLSYLLLRGRCRQCGQAISWRYPTVELLNAAIYAGLAAKYGWQPLTFKAALFASMMVALIFTDIEHRILPDEITLGGMWFGLGLSLVIPMAPTFATIFWLFSGEVAPVWQASFAESLCGVGIFGGLLWLMREAYYRVRGFDGLGLGDVKMAAMMGAFWGVGPTLLILLLGSVSGAAIGSLVVLLGGRKWNYEMPFGSYLGAAGLVVTLWGDDLFGLYWLAVGR